VTERVVGGGEPGSESAVAVAAAVVRDLGLRCDDPTVLRDAWHVLVHLRPLPIVARVSSSIPFPEGPRHEDVIRELDVARHAVSAGAPVIPPATSVDPGPHRRDGRIVTLWRYIERQGEVDPRSAGRRLRVIHDALRGYDGELPLCGRPGETVAMLDSVEPSADAEFLRELASRTVDAPGQPLHGDAHLFNCLPSADGMLWHDLETACHGPCEYDLAALALHDRAEEGGHPPSRAALAAYGEYDAALLDELLPAYASWVYASWLVALPRRPELAPVLRRRLDWLRQTVR
jgi:hypothetical protein